MRKQVPCQFHVHSEMDSKDIFCIEVIYDICKLLSLLVILCGFYKNGDLGFKASLVSLASI